ncbi:MAG: YitT family protein [Lachnospiraceae bacterium]|nr:YitT family protein [Lachnospiraceae bacterium]
MERQKKIVNKRNLITVTSVVGSSFLMSFAMNIFMSEAALLPAGFMGVAKLVNLIGESAGIKIDTSLVLLLINLPVALFCAKKISKRFVFFSLMHVLMLSCFMSVIPVYHIFDKIELNVIFGGCIYGGAIALALRGGASTGGTDFIALYVSNKTGKEIWMQVFVFNCLLLTTFGYLFGWENAGYSIIFQYISTHMITTFHNRYKREMMQIFTKKPDIVVREYLDHFRHGITVMSGTGGYTGEDTSMLVSVTSAYELPEAIHIIRKADPEAIINVTKTSRFIGKFHQPNI